MFCMLCSVFHRRFSPQSPTFLAVMLVQSFPFRCLTWIILSYKARCQLLKSSLSYRGRERKRKREGERKRHRREKICKMKALAKERGKSMLLFTGKKKKNTANWTVDSNKRKHLDTHTLQFTFSTHWTAQFPLGALLRISHSHSELKYVFNKISLSKKIKGYLRVISLP